MLLYQPTHVYNDSSHIMASENSIIVFLEKIGVIIASKDHGTTITSEQNHFYTNFDI